MVNRLEDGRSLYVAESSDSDYHRYKPDGGDGARQEDGSESWNSIKIASKGTMMIMIGLRYLVQRTRPMIDNNMGAQVRRV